MDTPTLFIILVVLLLLLIIADTNPEELNPAAPGPQSRSDPTVAASQRDLAAKLIIDNLYEQYGPEPFEALVSAGYNPEIWKLAYEDHYLTFLHCGLFPLSPYMRTLIWQAHRRGKFDQLNEQRGREYLDRR